MPYFRVDGEIYNVPLHEDNYVHKEATDHIFVGSDKRQVHPLIWTHRATDGNEHYRINGVMEVEERGETHLIWDLGRSLRS